MTVLEKEWLRRLMIRYFMMQNITDFDEKVYPPDLMDLPMQVPELIDKIEIVPYSINADPNWGLVKTGWNLFILGNQRMDLGYTYHTSPMEIRPGGKKSGKMSLKHSAKEVVNFIVNTLSDERELDLAPRGAGAVYTNPMVPSSRPKIGPTLSGGYYETNRIRGGQGQI